MTKRLLASMWWGRTHQGGWDEVLMIFGFPIVFFVLMRWLAARRGRDDDQDGTS